jgi:ABC-type nitrate/sulfonate/bicarbonate transport system substrate-binding protein
MTTTSLGWTTRIVLLVVALLTLAAACSDSGKKEPLDRVVFMAGFKPQANLPFVAAYVAETMGYFRDQHLDVEILHASSGEHLKLLISGDVDVTTASGASVLKRRADPELPVVAIALFGQQSQQAFMSLKNSGIKTPKDWEGKTLGYKISVPPEYLGILEANGVDRSKITEVRVGFDPRILTEGKVDVLAVFNSNEPDTVRNLGFEVNVWEPADFGVPSMGLTYITREDLIEKEPEKLKRFMKATMKGLRYALDNPVRALHMTMLKAPQNDIEHEDFMLRTELGDAVSPLTEAKGLGWMTDEQWKSLYDQLLKFNALPGPFDYQAAYTDIFL